jgi:hydroxymethylpyrimidine/phosphomethylpyrimidine kinase
LAPRIVKPRDLGFIRKLGTKISDISYRLEGEVELIWPVVMTIAGSDPVAGAGIQADLKTFSALGAYGLSVITAITSQNTSAVQRIMPLPPDLVASQIDSVFMEAEIEVWKTGMLANAEIVEIVAQKIKEYGPKKVIIDPVFMAGEGTPLLTAEGIECLKKNLLPLSYLVTPNIAEAGVLAGTEVKDPAGMREACRKIHQLGPKNVLVKGGHLPGPAIDLLYDGKEFRELFSERLPRDAHGTGCTLSAAIAAELAKGRDLGEAAAIAKTYISDLLNHGFAWRRGKYLMFHASPLIKNSQRYTLVQEMLEGLEVLKTEEIGHLIPEVQSNMGIALPDARGVEDVLAIPGRIIRLDKTITWIKLPTFGASQHIAKIILTVLKYDPHRRAAMNIRYSPEIIRAGEQIGLKIGSFSRDKEPGEIKDQEGKSLEWGVSWVIEELGVVPDLIYDTGGWGKEAMIRVIGKDAKDIVSKVIALHKAMMRNIKE